MSLSKLDQISNRINLDQPRYDQSTYSGRAKHFFDTTNPINLFCSTDELNKSKDIITRYRNGENFSDLSEDQLWRWKTIYDSAHHVETGQRQVLIGRMSAQVPMNMLITGCMLTFYKTTPQVIFWQWFNQSFNAVVNYTNRSGDSPLSVKQMGTSYAMACGGALGTALGLKSLCKNVSPIFARFVPFASVAAANMVNIPFVRKNELVDGIQLLDKDGNKVGQSQVAAKRAISQVVLSRIGMAAPGMIITPLIMDRLEKKGILKRMPWISAPLQVFLAGLFLTFSTPACCALFPQNSSIDLSELEPELQEKIKKLNLKENTFYYNKGL